MALEELIVAWGRERPAWQRDVMRRVAVGDRLSDEDYDQLVDNIVADKKLPESTFGLAQLPQTMPDDLPVRLVSIENPEHVNALESKVPLTFEPLGLTIIYGDNGSGKSGYARLLKRITRARHREEVLSDVFRDTALATPSAILGVRIGNEDVQLNWPESARPELQRMLFYDAACGNAYIAAESDFPYRPSALFVMDGLIEACVEVRNRVDRKLTENAVIASTVPTVHDDVRNTDAGRFLATLSGDAPIEVLDRLIEAFDESSEPIEGLLAREARLRNADTSKERRDLTRQSEKLDGLRRHLEQIHAVLGDEGLAAFESQRGALRTLEDAATLLAGSFESEPLTGVGSSPWKALWEAATRYSEVVAYPGQPFPVVVEDSLCVLCQQALQADGRERLLRFYSFVRDDTQVRLRDARQLYDRHVERVSSLVISPEAVADNLKDLDATQRDVVAEVSAFLAACQTAKQHVLEALANARDIPLLAIQPGAVNARLTSASTAAMATVGALANPDAIQKQLTELTRRRTELELLQEIKKSRDAIVREIARRKEREALETAKSAAATGPITKKILELSEESITEVVRDKFTRETERLRLDRVTIARTRADKGALLHQPKLVGARQQVTLPRVFSEGEQTALGLAAFFTEAQLDVSNSAIILDDPVTSLDHIRRGLVAARLAELTKTRQVVVFTHDVSFVADLMREAKGAPIAERSVMRSRADEHKPGACTAAHPWKAKDVPARLDELRGELARIKKDSGSMDQKAYEDSVAVWAGSLSETWERIFSQEIVGQILADGGLEVRPKMVKIIARFSDTDHQEFQASYSRVSQWAKRHDKSAIVNYVAPEVQDMEQEVDRVDSWFKRVRGYKN
jgi:energy-coupling factor transporter ATP-binding protein EcfA2